MSEADLIEMLWVWCTVPIGFFTIVFRVASAGFVYFDSQQYSRSQLFSLFLAISVFLFFWPLSYFGYVLLVVYAGRRRHRRWAEPLR